MDRKLFKEEIKEIDDLIVNIVEKSNQDFYSPFFSIRFWRKHFRLRNKLKFVNDKFGTEISLPSRIYVPVFLILIIIIYLFDRILILKLLLFMNESLSSFNVYNLINLMIVGFLFFLLVRRNKEKYLNSLNDIYKELKTVKKITSA